MYVLLAIVSVLLPVPGGSRISMLRTTLFVTRVHNLGSAPKLVTTWTVPWRAVPGGSSQAYNVQDVVTGETKEVRVVQMLAYENSSLAVGADVQGLFEMTKDQGEYEIQDILNIGQDQLKAGTTRCRLCGNRWR